MNFPLPTPALKAFSSVSPSRYFGMRECLLREAFAYAKPEHKLPSSPKAALGTVSHRLLEESSKGLVGPDRKAYECRWDEMVATEEVKLPSFQQPLRKSCADYGVTRALALMAAERSHADRKPAKSEGQSEERLYGSELLFETQDKKFRGLIDLVLPSADGPVIRDYKTGKIVDTATNEIKAAYDLQLKLYAAIYADRTGCWPCRAELIALSGQVFSVDIDKRECVKLMDEARIFLARSNKLLDQISNGVLPASEAANPSSENCKFCLYRPYCGTYLGFPKTGSELEWPCDLLGMVSSTANGPNDKWICTVRSADNNFFVVRRLSNHRYARPTIGSNVGFFSLKRENAPNTFKEGPTTCLLV